MVTSPHLSVSSSGQDTSLFLRAGPDPQASGGSLVLEGHRSSQMGLPCPFPGSSQSFPFNPPRRSCCPTFGCSLGLRVRHLSPLVEKVTASGQWRVLLEFQPGNSPTVKVLKNTFTYLTWGAKCLRGKGNSLTQTEYIILETWKLNESHRVVIKPTWLNILLP